MPDSSPDWPRATLHVVTGKGGTGKSTVAAALALALASKGKNVLLCEVEGRQGIARMFDVDQLPYEERRIAAGLTQPDGASGTVYALHIDAESALLEYLAMYYRLGRAGRALDRFGVIEFATTIAPGVRDVLLTGKVFEAAKEGRRGKNVRQYDAVVLDAPPTGRIVAVPRRQQRAGRAGQDGSDQEPGRSGDDAVPLAEDGGPPGHRAGGDAGPGDRRRDRGPARRRPARRRRGRQHGAAAGPRQEGPHRCQVRHHRRCGPRRRPRSWRASRPTMR